MGVISVPMQASSPDAAASMLYSSYVTGDSI